MKNPPRFAARALLDAIVGFKCFAILAEKQTPHRCRPHLRFRYNLYRTSKSSGEPHEEAGNDGCRRRGRPCPGMKRRLLIAVPLLALVGLAAWMLRPRRETLGEAFVSEKAAPLLSSIAQVREQIGMLHYGERVGIVGKRNDYVKVRTNSGTVGWVESRQLMEPALWQRSIKLLEQTRGMPVQARGRTKVSTNLRVQPGRTEPRLYQFGRNVSVEIVGRAVADWAQVTDEKDSSNEPQETKKEDWFLIRGVATRPPGEAAARAAEATNTTQPGDQTAPIAG